MRTCQDDLVQYCRLPNEWRMDGEKDDTQIGIYLSCLYQHQPKV